MENKIIKLKHPIPIPKEGGGFVDVSELQLRRPKAKHVRELHGISSDDQGDISFGTFISLVAKLADIPEASADEIDMEDIDTISAVVGDFFLMFQEHGESTSGE